MNILCVFSTDNYATPPSQPLIDAYEIPFGFASIITVLQQAGHNVALLVFNPKTNFRILRECIERHKSELACFSSVYTQYDGIRKIAGKVKAIDPSIYTIIGGIHATLNPDSVIHEPCFDALCVGEGEVAIVRLAEMLEKGEPGNIHNIWFNRSDGEIEKNHPDPFIQDIDTLPYPNRRIWDQWILNRNFHGSSILVGRGCVFRCSYCCNHSLAKVATGKYLRFRSVENVIGEIKTMIHNSPHIRIIYFEVENLTLDFNYLSDLCEALKKLNDGLKEPLGFGTNIAITKKLMVQLDLVMEKLKMANFQYINTGLESGSPVIRKFIRRPEYDNEDMIKFCHKLRENDMDVNFYILIGVPDETPADFKQTIDITKKCLPGEIRMSIFFPYPGTDLYNYAKEKGYLRVPGEFDRFSERINVFLDDKGFTRRQILHQFRWFPYKVYQGVRPFHTIVIQVIDRVLYTSRIFSPVYKVCKNKLFKWIIWLNNQKQIRTA